MQPIPVNDIIRPVFIIRVARGISRVLRSVLRTTWDPSYIRNVRHTTASLVHFRVIRRSTGHYTGQLILNQPFSSIIEFADIHVFMARTVRVEPGRAD